MLGDCKLIALIGDQESCVGFLLGGIGEVDRSQTPIHNFLVVESSTEHSVIEETFRNFVKRPDIGIILINQTIANEIRHLIDAHRNPIPAILEIPSKDKPYEPNEDSVLKRASAYFHQ